MVQLLKDIAYLRRARREVRSRVHAEWAQQGKWRPRWWTQLTIWGGAVLGICLLFLGDTIERVFGVGFLVPPTVILAINLWVYWKALRMLRKERRPR